MEGDSSNLSSTPSNAVLISDVSYKAEEMSLFIANTNDIGSPQMINETVYVPIIAESVRWSEEIIERYGEPDTNAFQISFGSRVARITHLRSPCYEEMLEVGKDIFFGEDFFANQVFYLYEYDINSYPSSSLTHYYFEPDISHVNLLAFNIVSQSEPYGVQLLANQMTENGEFFTIFIQLTYNSSLAKETVIEQRLIGGENKFVYDAIFDSGGNILLGTVDLHTQEYEIVILDPTATKHLAKITPSIEFNLAQGRSGEMWGIGQTASRNTGGAILYSLNSETWAWNEEVDLPINNVVGLYAAPDGYELEWFVYTELGLYGLSEDFETVLLIEWHDISVRVSHDSELLFTDDEEIIVLTRDVFRDGTKTLESTLLRQTDDDDKREVVTVGGANIITASLLNSVRRFNRMSETHRIEIVDYADIGEWEGVAMRLRADLIAGRGPDVIIFNLWGDENDITSAMMRGGFLADMNVFLENDPNISREDFFENILNIWRNEAGELLLITGAVEPMMFMGPGDKLDSFTDFTHKGYLEFLRTAKADGVKYPAGVNYLPQEILRTMLFADNTFFCYETGTANFDNELFVEILEYAASIPKEQETRWIDGLSNGEAATPLNLIISGEQLMTNMISFMHLSMFRLYDAAFGGLTPIGNPNSAGELSISALPYTRMGIRANSQNKEAAWEFISLYVQEPNTDSSYEGIPILRRAFEEEIEMMFLGEPFSGKGFMGITGDFTVHALTQERAKILWLIMESITHEYHPDPHIFAIILEDTAPFFAGGRTAEEAARIIQSRVSRYLSEMN